MKEAFAHTMGGVLTTRSTQRPSAEPWMEEGVLLVIYRTQKHSAINERAKSCLAAISLGMEIVMLSEVSQMQTGKCRMSHICGL